jgi:hypothetical protein
MTNLIKPYLPSLYSVSMLYPSPLRAGNIITVSASLYRTYFKQNCRISISAALWSSLPLGVVVTALLLTFILLARLTASFATQVLQSSKSGVPLLQSGNAGLVLNPSIGLSNLDLFPINLATILIAIVLGCVGLILIVLGSAMVQLRNVQISQLSYGVISGQPETPNQVLRNLNPKLWQLWRLGVMTTVLQVLVSYVTDIPVAFLIKLLQPLMGELIATTALNIGQYIFLSGIFGILSLAHLIVAIERVNSLMAITRAWRLASGHGLHIILVTSIAFLITMPPYILVASFPVMTGFALVHSLSMTQFYIFLGSLVLSAVLMLVLNVVLIPVLPIVQAVTYYDLRVRQEGVGMRLGTPDARVIKLHR